MFDQYFVMKKNIYTNFRLASLAFYFILNLSKAFTLHQKFKVTYATSAVLIFMHIHDCIIVFANTRIIASGMIVIVLYLENADLTLLYFANTRIIASGMIVSVLY